MYLLNDEGLSAGVRAAILTADFDGAWWVHFNSLNLREVVLTESTRRVSYTLPEAVVTLPVPDWLWATDGDNSTVQPVTFLVSEAMVLVDLFYNDLSLVKEKLKELNAAREAEDAGNK